jgi:uncharacterized protein YjiS (DUF1127 family)
MSSTWSQLKRSFIEWSHGIRCRRELANFNDRILRDIGLPRDSSCFQSSMPFWFACSIVKPEQNSWAR